MQLDRLRPEFRSGLDALTKFVLERTRPKQVGATILTGPVLVGITQLFLDAMNNGAVPTISSSWQVSLFLMVNYYALFVFVCACACVSFFEICYNVYKYSFVYMIFSVFWKLLFVKEICCIYLLL